MKEWKCLQVLHYKKIAEAIGEHQRDGWNLYTYSAAGTAGEVKHYLLFERGNGKKTASSAKAAISAAT